MYKHFLHYNHGKIQCIFYRTKLAVIAKCIGACTQLTIKLKRLVLMVLAIHAVMTTKMTGHSIISLHEAVVRLAPSW